MQADSSATHDLPLVDQTWADSLRQLEEYDYSVKGRSFLDEIMRAIEKAIWEALDGRADSIEDFIAYGLILALLGIAVWAIARSRSSSPIMLSRRGKVTALEEELEEVEDYDRAIGEAVAERAFRRAVRYLYQRTLARFRDVGIIEWRAEKTDAEYVRESRSHLDEPAVFATAVREFQRVWYGEDEIDEEQFSRIRSLFDQLHRGTAH